MTTAEPKTLLGAARAGQTAAPARFNFARDVVDAQDPDRVALTWVSADTTRVRDVTYGTLADASSRLAGALAGLGLAPGARVLVVMGRVPDWHVVLLACMKAGLVALPGTPLLTAGDIAYRLAASAAQAVVTGPDQLAKVPAGPIRIVAGTAPPGWHALDDLIATGPATGAVDTAATDPMLIYFTSGTTSAPKMVPRDHAYGLAHAVTGVHWMDLRPDGLHWTLTDTGWAKAAWGMMFPQLLLGTRIFLYEGGGAFDADLHLRLIGRHGVTSFCAPPTLYRLFAQMDLGTYDLSSLRRCLGAGEPLNPEAMRVWTAATGLDIADGYGQTESIAVVGNMPGMAIRPGSMGRPLPGIEVAVVDEAGAELAPEQIGHIAVRPGAPGLFDGYLTADGIDRRAFRHGWYYTGDTARRDADGYLWFIGRADDLILSAAYRISPFEVESALLEHPAVAESAVVGAPDPIRGQIVKAFIVLAAGVEGTPALAEDIQAFCKRQTAPYKYPREIAFVRALPKTISGKIRRVELRGG